jgi:hypothetical protein
MIQAIAERDEDRDAECSEWRVQFAEKMELYVEVAGEILNRHRARCLCGKARYATEREAGRDAKRIRYKGRGHSYKGLLRPYQCPERKGIWHVGHTDE